MKTGPLGDAELEKLATTLRGMRGTSSYPPTARELFAAANIDRDPVKLATSTKAGKRIRILAKRGQKAPDYYAAAPVFLVEDTDDVLGSDGVLLRVVRLCRTDSTNVYDLAALKTVLPEALKASFAACVERRTQRGGPPLPAGIGFLKRNEAPLLFLLEDVEAATPRAITVTPPRAVEIRAPFPEAFGQAFDELDQESGRRNYVLLHDLRRRLSAIPRPDFDEGLNELRRSKLYSLGSADGRHVRLSPEQIDAGIREAGSVLVYVARR